MTKVLVSRPVLAPVLAALEAQHEVTVRDIADGMSDDEMIAALGQFDAILPTLGDNFSAAIFAAAAAAGPIRTQVLANYGVGYNHIDTAAARAHGIAVTNTPGVLTDATADLGMTLLLMTARLAGEGERLVRSGNWEGWMPGGRLGTHVTGKTVGIVGMGRIGQAVARRCHFGFGMEVVYFNRSQKSVDLPARQAPTLQALAAAADFVVVTVPGGAETRHLVGADVFAAMKPSGIFINIARGDVVDEAALVAALQAGRIAGAGLDVYEHEPVVPAALMAMENVTLLPHLGSATLETRTAMGMLAADNVLAALAGKPLPTPV
jgi:hydroxypyruvate reductase